MHTTCHRVDVPSTNNLACKPRNACAERMCVSLRMCKWREVDAYVPDGVAGLLGRLAHGDAGLGIAGGLGERRGALADEGGGQQRRGGEESGHGCGGLRVGLFPSFVGRLLVRLFVLCVFRVLPVVCSETREKP